MLIAGESTLMSFVSATLGTASLVPAVGTSISSCLG